MNSLFKKHFWIIHLATLALLAWLCSGMLNDWLMGSFFVVPEARGATGAEREASHQLTAGRVPQTESAADTLTARRIFDLFPSDGEGVGAATGAASTEEKGDEEKPLDEEKVEESDLPIDLVGTIVSNDPTESMATIKIDGNVKLAWVGMKFVDDKAEVVRIAQRHVILKESDGYTVIKLWDDGATPAASAGRGRGSLPGRAGKDRPGRSPQPKAANDRSKNNKSGRRNYSEGVKKTGAYDYEIDRAMLDEELQDLSALGTQARVVPNYRNGKYEGFKLVGVRPGSLYRAIGIRSGDVIKSINGKPIDSPNKAIQLFDKLKGSSNLSMELERRGQLKEFSYTIK